MKTKKTTWLAVAAALALVAFVTTAFATTEQAAAESSGRRAAAGRVQLVTNDYTVTSYTDPADGQTYYSWDGGATWTAMTEREFNAASGWGEVEWWTAEEYAAWLEQERLELGSIVGSQGWTPSTGWFTWTQEMVDEALARYEQTLKDIRGGIKISKPLAEGDTLLQFGFEPDNQIAAADTRVVVGFEGKPANSFGGNMADDYKQQPAPELLAEYEAHGLTYEAAAKAFYFNGKPVRWFADFVELEEGAFATRYVYRNDVGTEYIHTVRRRIDNGDGSYDPFGQLTGIVPWEAGERDGFGFLFQGGQVGQVTAVFGSEDSAGTTFEELFARYKEFGITYVEAAGSSGRGNVYLNGRLVSRFADVSPRGDAFSFTSAQQGGIWVQTDYDGSGKLIGVQEMLPDAIAADKRAQEYVREEYRAEFRRVQEELSPYLAFGLDCQMDFDTGRLTMTWQGRPVHRFSDTKLGLFVADSLGGGGLGAEAVDLEAAYDGSGKLTGLATASARVTP